MRNFVMSDMHGHEFAARALLDYAGVNLSQDKMRFLGDYIDRGPNSYGCIRLVRKLQYEGAHVHMGNHELMLLLWAAGELDTQSYYMNGGNTTIKSFEKSGVMSDTLFQDVLKWISELKITDEDDEYLYVHAGINPNKVIWDRNDALWIREEFLNARPEHITQAANGKVVVHGHTPMENVCFDGVKINTDIGAGGRNKLALVELTERVVYVYDFQQARLNGKEYAIEEVAIKDSTPVSLY